MVYGGEYAGCERMHGGGDTVSNPVDGAPPGSSIMFSTTRDRGETPLRLKRRSG